MERTCACGWHTLLLVVVEVAGQFLALDAGLLVGVRVPVIDNLVVEMISKVALASCGVSLLLWPHRFL